MSKNVSTTDSLSSFSVIFYPNLLRSKDSSFKIFCRITIDRKKSEFFTNIEVPKTKWNIANNTPREIHVEDELYEIQSHLRKIRRRFIDQGLYPTAKDVVMVFKGADEKLTGKQFIPYYKDFITKSIQMGELSRSTIKHYNGTLRIFQQFLSKMNLKSLLTDEIDSFMLKEFDEFLILNYRSNQEKKITRNTAGKHHSRLKAILNRALIEGIIFKNPYDNFKIKFEKTDRDRLTVDELKLFENLDFRHDNRSVEILDIFLFTCYTGIRFEDAQNLTQQNVVKDGNDISVTFRMTKTNESLSVPLILKAIAIIKKYEGKYDSKKLLPKYSNQKFNLYFKEIVRLSGLGRDITHHIGRHTFATIALNNGIPLEVVQKVLGHNSIRTTQIYAKMLPKTIREQMRKME